MDRAPQPTQSSPADLSTALSSCNLCLFDNCTFAQCKHKMLLANYASDSDSDNEAGPSKPASRDPQPVTRPNAVAPSKGKKRAGPIKITLDPLTSKAGKDDEDGDQGRGSGPEEDERDAKKSKVVPKGGKGS